MIYQLLELALTKPMTKGIISLRTSLYIFFYYCLTENSKVVATAKRHSSAGSRLFPLLMHYAIWLTGSQLSY